MNFSPFPASDALAREEELQRISHVLRCQTKDESTQRSKKHFISSFDIFRRVVRQRLQCHDDEQATGFNHGLENVEEFPTIEWCDRDDTSRTSAVVDIDEDDEDNNGATEADLSKLFIRDNGERHPRTNGLVKCMRIKSRLCAMMEMQTFARQPLNQTGKSHTENHWRRKANRRSHSRPKKATHQVIIIA